MRLTAKDIGPDEGRFPPHVLTDGGVYDNLGVRMFQYLRESWIGHDTPLSDNDFIDLREAVETLNAAGSESEQPLGRLAALVRKRCANNRRQPSGISADDLPASLWNVIVYDQLYGDEVMRDLALECEQATDLFNLARHGRRLDRGEHLWLNRNLANAAYATAGKGSLLRSTQTEFDTVIVSDAGREFYVSRQTTGGGLLATSIRASDILMDRVWKLELDHFHAEQGFVFALITSTVHLADDSTALHPEIQRQVAVMRTDLDRFSDLEISGLIRHGYGVMRQACRSRQDLFGDDLPSADRRNPQGHAK